MHKRTDTRMQARTHTHTHTHTQAQREKHTNICTLDGTMCVCMSVCPCSCVHVHVCVCVCLCMCMCVRVCATWCVRNFVCVSRNMMWHAKLLSTIMCYIIGGMKYEQLCKELSTYLSCSQMSRVHLHPLYK